MKATDFAADVVAIQQIIARYALGQDGHQGTDDGVLTEWGEVFTPDGTVDFRESNGPQGSYRDLALHMRGTPGQPGRMNGFLHWQHMLSLPVILVGGDEATARTDFLAMHRVDPAHRVAVRLDALGAFHDHLVRTTAVGNGGWRIKHRRVELYFADYLSAAPAEQYS